MSGIVKDATRPLLYNIRLGESGSHLLSVDDNAIVTCKRPATTHRPVVVCSPLSVSFRLFPCLLLPVTISMSILWIRTALSVGRSTERQMQYSQARISRLRLLGPTISTRKPPNHCKSFACETSVEGDCYVSDPFNGRIADGVSGNLSPPRYTRISGI